MKTFVKKLFECNLRFWFQPVDTIKIDTLRVFVGFSFLLYMAERWMYAAELFTAKGFHISPENLPFHPFVMPLMPNSFLPWFGIIMFGSIFAFIMGWRTKWFACILFICISYVTFVDQLSAFTLNKLFIVSFAVFILASGGPYWSLRSAESSTQSVWPIRIFQLTLVLQYFFSGLAKVHYGDWLTSQLTLWTQVQGYFRTDFAAWMIINLPKPIWTMMQWASLSFELAAPFIFFYRPTRRLAMIWGVVFHLMIGLTMHQIYYFSLFLVCFYVLFMEDESLHKVRGFSKRL